MLAVNLYITQMERLKVYLLATRPAFFPAIIFPVVLGTAAARKLDSLFDPLLFALTLAAALLYHGGMNVANDYFDHLNGTDAANKSPLTPFTGGSRMIQNSIMTPRETLVLAAALLSAGSAIGLYLATYCGWPLLAIGAFGLISGVFYSAPPVFLAGRGLGELTVGLNFGLLTVSGAYFVQSGGINAQVVAVSLPLTLLVTAILYVNEFPDFDADKASGKKTLVVRLGLQRGRWGMVVITLLTYVSIIAPAVAGLTPPHTLLALATALFLIIATGYLFRSRKEPWALLLPIKCVIIAHSATGTVLVLSLII